MAPRLCADNCSHGFQPCAARRGACRAADALPALAALHAPRRCSVRGHFGPQIGARGSQSVTAFLGALTIVGTAWMLAFPLAVFTAGMVTQTRRHAYITVVSLLLQSGALMGLTVLVTDERFRTMSTLAVESDSLDTKRDSRGRPKVAVD